MAIILKSGAVFLHITKTGGNWVTKMLESQDLIQKHVHYKHADISHYFSPFDNGRRQFLPYAIQRMLKMPQAVPYMFCFVRNPLSWYESWFKYMSQSSRQWRSWGSTKGSYQWHPNSPLNDLGPCDFPEMMRRINVRCPGYVSEMFGTYTKPEMDFIGKQENLVDDLVKVLKHLNENFDEDFIRSHEKVGVSPDKEITWPEGVKKETARYEYAGLVRYGYQSTLTELGLELPMNLAN